MVSQKSIAQRFKQLDSQRNAHLERARECASLTVPYVLPPSGQDESQQLPIPYNTHGARCVNNLSSKLLMVLFPPQFPFFRLDLSDYDFITMANEQEVQETPESEKVTLKDKIMEGFSRVENSAIIMFESLKLRAKLIMICLSMIVCGSAAWMWNKKTRQLRPYRLDNWVCQRDPEGTLIELIIQEFKTAETLDVTPGVKIYNSTDQKIPVYTRCVLLEGGKGLWEVTQEINGRVYGEPLIVGREKFPFYVSNWSLLPGEHYGRGHVENNLGGFRTLESGRQIIIEGTAASSKIIFLVDPNGSVKASEVAEVPNGGFVEGSADSINALQVGKYHDFRGLSDLMQVVTQELSFAFLLNSSIQRQGERVTAEEIRLMAQELEDSLGGSYTHLSEELQVPIAKILLDELQKNSVKFPSVVKEYLGKEVSICVTTGVEGLGRSHQLSRFRGLLQDLATMPSVVKRIKEDVLSSRLASLHGVDIKGLLRSDAEMQAINQQEIQTELALKATPNAVTALNQQYMQQNQPKQGE